MDRIKNHYECFCEVLLPDSSSHISKYTFTFCSFSSLQCIKKLKWGFGAIIMPLKIDIVTTVSKSEEKLNSLIIFIYSMMPKLTRARRIYGNLLQA